MRFIITLLSLLLTAQTCFGSVIFAVRGTQLDAWYSTGMAKHYGLNADNGTSSPPVVTSLGDPSVFGGQAIDLAGTGHGIYYSGQGNSPPDSGGWAILMRIVPKWTGNPVSSVALMQMGSSNYYNMTWSINTSGKLVVSSTVPWGSTMISFTSSSALSFTTGVATDIMMSTDGTNTSGHVQFGQDGVSIGTATATNANGQNTNPQIVYPAMAFGFATGVGNGNNHYLNELVIFNNNQSVTYSARSGFWSLSTFNGTQCTDPGGSNVLSSAGNYYINGTSITPTLSPPSAGILEIGQTYLGVTGTYDGSDRWTDPGIGNVLLGTLYKANSTTNNRDGTYACAAAPSCLTLPQAIGLGL